MVILPPSGHGLRGFEPGSSPRREHPVLMILHRNIRVPKAAFFAARRSPAQLFAQTATRSSAVVFALRKLRLAPPPLASLRSVSRHCAGEETCRLTRMPSGFPNYWLQPFWHRLLVRAAARYV
jgi:hypothetical protein